MWIVIVHMPADKELTALGVFDNTERRFVCADKKTAETVVAHMQAKGCTRYEIWSDGKKE